MILIVVDSISTLLFGFSACSFTQFALGLISIYNLIKNSNDMDLFAIYDLERWVGASAGLFTAKSESDMMKTI